MQLPPRSTLRSTRIASEPVRSSLTRTEGAVRMRSMARDANSSGVDCRWGWEAEQAVAPRSTATAAVRAPPPLRTDLRAMAPHPVRPPAPVRDNAAARPPAAAGRRRPSALRFRRSAILAARWDLRQRPMDN
ncbi:hypothetical protein GCM10017688_50240 [Streptomyces ramulosus]